jgi:transposase InsO family protein
MAPLFQKSVAPLARSIRASQRPHKSFSPDRCFPGGMVTRAAVGEPRRARKPALLRPCLRENSHIITCLMNRRGNCRDNAPTEALFNSLKNERVHGASCAIRADGTPAAPQALALTVRYGCYADRSMCDCSCALSRANPVLGPDIKRIRTKNAVIDKSKSGLGLPLSEIAEFLTLLCPQS